MQDIHMGSTPVILGQQIGQKEKKVVLGRRSSTGWVNAADSTAQRSCPGGSGNGRVFITSLCSITGCGFPQEGCDLG